jgi:hypothetical protein
MSEAEMLKMVVAGILLTGALVASSPDPSAQTFGSNQRCLHGSEEQAVDRARREQAVRVARQINRAENMASLRGPSQPRSYVPLDDPRIASNGIPAAPDGFKLRFYTDTESYAFSLKDARDRCGFAVFSDQDGRVYAGQPMSANAQGLPADIP